MAFVAVLRKINGVCLKMPKVTGAGNLFLPDTKPANLHTYIQRWPRRLTSFVCFGGSVRTLLQQQAVRALVVPRRGYIALAADEAAPLDSRRHQLSLKPLLEIPHQQEQPKRPVKAGLPQGKVGLPQLRQKHESQDPIIMVTAYDYPSARIADGSGVDLLLVGDSLGMVVLGEKDTTTVTMEQMVHHCRAVSRGASRAMIVGDMPFGSCLTPEEAARNGVRLIKEGRVDAVKVEGGLRMVPQIRALVDSGVAVMGHLGLTPQSHQALGGFKVQAKTAQEAIALLHEAIALHKAGCFAIVLEMVPAVVAEAITQRLAVPTIGIGAGSDTSGQVQVLHDILGMYDGKFPRFSHQFTHVEEAITAALVEYSQAVTSRAFPAARHTFNMKEVERRALVALLEDEPPPRNLPPPAHPSLCLSSNAGGLSIAHVAHRGVNGSAAVIGKRTGDEVWRLARPKVPKVIRSVAEWRRLRGEGVLSSRLTHGLVPTMGALHCGHLSLVKRAAKENDVVSVSIFVNPKQFAAGEDLDRYPRTFDTDLEALTPCGVDYVFAPSAKEMYPAASTALSPFVDLIGVEELSEGARRPGFFRGVATVVSKLLNITQPRRAYFGQKDGLQCIVVKRMVEMLNFDTEIVICETVREVDGLAFSSRNVYLTPTERAVAPKVYGALCRLKQLYTGGERRSDALRSIATQVISGVELMRLEYVSIMSGEDGRELELIDEWPRHPVTAAIAVRLTGGTRLIDNVTLNDNVTL
eukprot:CAMPEP_0119301528 /NCGR_PEP_ID=MMETSP1333-20130426/3300_1 /TAXON_ID=418940 /ORGANISM="Scyphosphaera apsteinii, Strain RCC1455" /LENGTH=749 /DNA_ID=CAMNT_0007303633 /DNA_START=16 /DNA_END=2265 /DNA_ORIENTATION=-